MAPLVASWEDDDQGKAPAGPGNLTPATSKLSDMDSRFEDPNEGLRKPTRGSAKRGKPPKKADKPDQMTADPRFDLSDGGQAPLNEEIEWEKDEAGNLMLVEGEDDYNAEVIRRWIINNSELSSLLGVLADEFIERVPSDFELPLNHGRFQGWQPCKLVENLEAAGVQLLGYPSPQACSKCIRGHRLFTECRKRDDAFSGACASCRNSKQQGFCSNYADFDKLEQKREDEKKYKLMAKHTGRKVEDIKKEYEKAQSDRYLAQIKAGVPLSDITAPVPQPAEDPGNSKKRKAADADNDNGDPGSSAPRPAGPVKRKKAGKPPAAATEPQDEEPAIDLFGRSQAASKDFEGFVPLGLDQFELTSVAQHPDGKSIMIGGYKYTDKECRQDLTTARMKWQYANTYLYLKQRQKQSSQSKRKQGPPKAAQPEPAKSKPKKAAPGGSKPANTKAGADTSAGNVMTDLVGLLTQIKDQLGSKEGDSKPKKGTKDKK